MFETFDSLVELVEWVEENFSDVAEFTWNNDAGDWDLDDIKFNARSYEEVYGSFKIDRLTYSIYGGEELIFSYNSTF